MSNYIELYSRSKARYLLGVCWMGLLTQLSEHKWHIWCSRGAKMQQVFQMSVDDAGWWICTQTAVRDLNMNQGFGVFNTRDVFENLFSLAIPPHTNLLDSLGCQLQIVRLISFQSFLKPLSLFPVLTQKLISHIESDF